MVECATSVLISCVLPWEIFQVSCVGRVYEGFTLYLCNRLSAVSVLLCARLKLLQWSPNIYHNLTVTGMSGEGSREALPRVH